LDSCKKRIKLPTDLPDPKYWKYTANDDDQDMEKQQTSYAVPKTGPAITRKDNEVNIIDEVYFDVAEPIIQQCLARVDEVLDFEAEDDPDLTRFFDQIWDSAATGSVIRTELKALKERLHDVKALWGEIYVRNCMGRPAHSRSRQV
jgi:hypothetical protein